MLRHNFRTWFNFISFVKITVGHISPFKNDKSGQNMPGYNLIQLFHHPQCCGLVGQIKITEV